MAFRRFSLFCLGLLAAVAEARGDLAPGNHDRSFEHGGAKRTYRLHCGKKITTPVPLVIVLHGMGADGKLMQALTGFDEVSDAHGFLLVYPDARNRVWNFWGPEDVAFLKALMDRLVQEKLADPHRIYATGISNGAYMTSRLAVDLNDRLAAIAPVAGTFAAIDLKGVKVARSIPVFYIHGTEDRIVGIDGKDPFTRKKSSLSGEEYVRWWSKRNRTADEPKVDKLPDRHKDGTWIERRTYPGKAEVVFLRVVGGGHTWPGGRFQPEFLLGRTSREVNASALLWEFFARYSR